MPAIKPLRAEPAMFARTKSSEEVESCPNGLYLPRVDKRLVGKLKISIKAILAELQPLRMLKPTRESCGPNVDYRSPYAILRLIN